MQSNNDTEISFKGIDRLPNNSNYWERFKASMDKFPEDFFEEGRQQEPPQERETLE